MVHGPNPLNSTYHVFGTTTVTTFRHNITAILLYVGELHTLPNLDNNNSHAVMYR